MLLDDDLSKCRANGRKVCTCAVTELKIRSLPKCVHSSKNNSSLLRSFFKRISNLNGNTGNVIRLLLPSFQ